MAEGLNCCGILAKVILILINIFYLVSVLDISDLALLTIAAEAKRSIPVNCFYQLYYFLDNWSFIDWCCSIFICSSYGGYNSWYCYPLDCGSCYNANCYYGNSRSSSKSLAIVDCSKSLIFVGFKSCIHNYILLPGYAYIHNAVASIH